MYNVFETVKHVADKLLCFI